MKPKVFSSPKSIFNNTFLDLYSVVADFGSFSKEYFVVKRGARVGVIMEKGNSVLLVKQYRYVINDYSWELPSGGVDSGESLEEAAIRECMEETGIKCENLTPIFDFILGADVADSSAYIYSCKNFYAVGDFDKKEISEIKWMPYQKWLEMIISGEIKDIFSIIGLLIYNLNIRRDGRKHFKYQFRENI